MHVHERRPELGPEICAPPGSGTHPSPPEGLSASRPHRNAGLAWHTSCSPWHFRNCPCSRHFCRAPSVTSRSREMSSPKTPHPAGCTSWLSASPRTRGHCVLQTSMRSFRGLLLASHTTGEMKGDRLENGEVQPHPQSPARFPPPQPGCWPQRAGTGTA